MSTSFKIDSAGIRTALSTPAVKAAVFGHAQRLAANANAMAGSPHAYKANQGTNANVGISNVATASKKGREDNSRNHTLQKVGGF